MNQATLPPAATLHRTSVRRQPDPNHPGRPWAATCSSCDWTWHSRYQTVATRLAHAHTTGAHQ